MHQPAANRSRPTEISRAQSILVAPANEKAFAKWAFVGISMLIAIVWFLPY